MNLREALDADLIGFDGYGNVTLPQEAFKAVHAAGRRFLALTETGPDATAHLCEAIHEDEIGFHYAVCSCGEYRTAPVPDLDLLVDELMAHAVRAALADYLTEEDR